MIIPLVPCMLITWTLVVEDGQNVKGNIKEESQVIDITFISQAATGRR